MVGEDCIDSGMESTALRINLRYFRFDVVSGLEDVETGQ